MGPRLPRVGGLVDAVADREVRTRQAFAAADVQDVGIRRRDDDPADRAGRLVVEDRLPRAAGVGRLPDAAVDHADVERVRLAGMACRRLGAPGPVRADVPPLHVGEEGRCDRWRLLRRERDDQGSGGNERQQQETQDSAADHAGCYDVAGAGSKAPRDNEPPGNGRTEDQELRKSEGLDLFISWSSDLLLERASTAAIRIRTRTAPRSGSAAAFRAATG